MMSQLFRLSIAVPLFCALAGCAIAPSTVPGKTLASPVLQRDLIDRHDPRVTLP